MAGYFFLDMYSNVVSLCRLQQKLSGTYICDVGGIFVWGQMQVMWNLCIQKCS